MQLNDCSVLTTVWSFRAAYRITGNLTDAEDVLQTVFLRLIGRDGAAPQVENSESDFFAARR